MDDADRNYRPHTITSSLALLTSSQISEQRQTVIASKDEQIITMLMQLALMYWRPDFNPGQQKQLLVMYLEDLRPYAISAIHEAIRLYRTDKDSKFFPASGQLLAYITTKPDWEVCSTAQHIARQRRDAESELDRMEMQLLEGPK